jgi:hypothetical protein
MQLLKGEKMKRIITMIIGLLIPVMMFADGVDSIQFLKENRMQWFDEKYIDELIEKSKLNANDDFIYIEERNTNFSLGLILLKQKTFYYYENQKIIKEKLSESVIKELSELKLHDSVKTDMRGRDLCYYNIFIKNGDTINYALFDNSINNNIDDETIEKDRQTAVKILDLFGLRLYFEW